MPQQVRLLKALKRDMEWVDRYDALATAVGDLAVLEDFSLSGECSDQELQQEIHIVEGKFSELELESGFAEEWDYLPVIVQIYCPDEAIRFDWSYSHLRMHPELEFYSWGLSEPAEAWLLEG